MPQSGKLLPVFLIHVIFDHFCLVAALVVVQPCLEDTYRVVGEIDFITAVIQVVGLENDAIGKYFLDKIFFCVEIRRTLERAMGGDDALERQGVDWVHVGPIIGDYGVHGLMSVIILKAGI
ncbi:hypothetical protein QZH46_03605 [Pseudomonas corrugata]